MQTTPRELPILGGIASVIRWLEELVSLLAGPLLTVGLGIALVALLSDGALLVRLPILVYIWAVSLAVGVDCQLIASFDRARQNVRERRYWSALVLLALGCVLAYVAWVSAYAFGVGQADHLSTTQALATLGMDNHTWLVQRFALQVFLVCLSGWERYHAPAKVKLSVEDELAEINRKVQIEAANQRLREQRAVGVAHIGRSLLAAAKGEQVQDETRPETPPTGPGTPLVSAPLSHNDDESEYDTDVLSLPYADESDQQQLAPAARGNTPSGPRAVRKTISAKVRETTAYQLLDGDPDLSVSELARQLGCRWETANALKKRYARSHLPQRRVQ